jgi:hypothetical protein
MGNPQIKLEVVDRLLTPRRISYVWLLGGILWLAWLANILLGPGNLDLTSKPVGTDFIQFYTAGETLRSGNEGSLYDLAYQHQQQLGIAQGEFDGYYAFLYPPFFAWLFVPISLLPYQVSFLLWSLAGLACLWYGLRLLKAKNPGRKFAWALTFFPVFTCVSFGQNSLLSLFLFSLVYALWKRRAGFWAGLAASLMLYKPQIILGLGLLWLLEWRRDWRALVGLAAGGSVLAGLTFGLLPQASQDYLGIVRNILPGFITWDSFPYHNAHMLKAFFTLLLPGATTLIDILTYSFMTLGVVIFIWLWMKFRGQPDLLFAMMICLTIWSIPYVMVYDWALLIIPAVIFWDHFPRSRRHLRVVYAILWLTILVSGPLTFAQRTILPVAIQISIPIFGWVLVITYRLLKNEVPTESISA